MNRLILVRSALAAALGCGGWSAFAQQSLEIIALKHRTVDQVLPVLAPLVEPGGTLTGQNNQLIVRASPANLAELRRALDAIDRPLRRLQISVSFDDALDAASRGAQASGTLGNRGSRVEIGAHDERVAAIDRVDQRVQVLEGGRAFIAAGRSQVLPPGQIHDISTGFQVTPRLSAERVLLDIMPVSVQTRIASTVSARLGEWVEIGGIVSSAQRDERGILAGRQSGRSEAQRIWVKVEEIRN
jgi:type II/III secretion system protein